ncbi:MAG: hypothetical protein HFI78_13200 [Lachnospiraceae bacterium]|jgi:hypothetical protein|nr:hypothetical protein [Lachnospiraceae bacterium]
MLKKLLKYEYFITARYFIPLYLCFITITLLNKLFKELDLMQDNFQVFDSLDGISKELITSAFRNLTNYLYALFLIAMFLLTTIFLIYRFYKNMTCDEAYLQFTLPVKPGTHIVNKLLVAYTWQLLTFLLVFFSFIVLQAGHGVLPFFQSLQSNFFRLFARQEGQALLLIALLFLIALLSFLSLPLKFYMCMGIGQLFHKHRLLGAIGCYMGLYLLLRFLSVIFFVLYTMFILRTNLTFRSSFISLNIFLGVIASFMLLLVIGYFSITIHLFKNKLNLQ